jgi:hypothetical protein
MRRAPRRSLPVDRFAAVKAAGLALPGVECDTKYDGSPRLLLDGCFMAGMATHPSAEADSFVVRVDLEERTLLLDEAPDTYYVTDYYRKHPVVLVRLSRIEHAALRDLLAMSRRVTARKVRRGPRPES